MPYDIHEDGKPLVAYHADLLRRELIAAQKTIDRLRADKVLLRRKLYAARVTLSSRSKLRVCKEIKRRDWVTTAHQCGVSLPMDIRLSLIQEPCRSLVEVGAGVIVLERCEYLRLARSIRKDDDCWEWIGTKGKAGYGLFNWDSQTWQAHRFIYTVFVGAIPFGLTIDHLCRNRACVNPEHLEAVTLGENIRRKPGYTIVDLEPLPVPALPVFVP